MNQRAAQRTKESMHEVAALVKIIRDTKYQNGCQGLRGGENGALLFNENKMKRAEGMDSGDGCMTTSVYLIPLNCTL